MDRPTATHAVSNCRCLKCGTEWEIVLLPTMEPTTVLCAHGCNAGVYVGPHALHEAPHEPRMVTTAR